MISHRKDHISESIKREITAIIKELKDPRIQNSLINIVKIDVSKDTSNCKIYISSLNGFEDAKKIVKVFQGSTGHIRKELGSRLRLRYVPNIFIEATDSIEYGINMTKIINGLN